MRITRYPLLTTPTPPSALTIGNFDGIHLGHQAILHELVTHAQKTGITPTVMTFEPHPKAFFAQQLGRAVPSKILSLRNKLSLLAQYGIQHTIVLPFNQHLASMQATDFVEKLLIEALNIEYLLVGDDFRFGAQRTGDFALLQSMSQTHGFTLNSHESVLSDSERVSSSNIRNALNQGDLTHAQQLLGRPVVLSGHVIYGQQLGRTIGCPTINLKMPHNLASQGIYAVSVEFNGQIHQGVASIGTRPSVKTNGECWLEVHILDFDQNVYGALAHVTLQHKIRNEAKFEGLEPLKAAIAQDIADARAFFAANLG